MLGRWNISCIIEKIADEGRMDLRLMLLFSRERDTTATTSARG
jgi:hypothetical protein